MTNVFETIYQTNSWHSGSGTGSDPGFTQGYQRFVEDFIRSNRIMSIVDFGCGDWQFSRLIDWQTARYVGLEAVSKLVKENNNKFATSNIQFKTTPSDWEALPPADLLLCKDVLQHFSSAEVDGFIKMVLPKYKFSLITNGVLPTNGLNRDIQTGDFRALDLRLKPFCLEATEVFSFEHQGGSTAAGLKLDPCKEVVLLTVLSNKIELS